MKFTSRTIYISLILFLISIPIVGQNDTGSDSSPNVLFISIDDMNDWIEPLKGHPQASTPNLAKFSQSSVNFERAYCASPGCNPSRGAILTGMHTYTTGLYSNYQDWRLIPKMKTVPTLNSYFKSEGYYTAGAGKIYHYTQTDPEGWDAYFPSKEWPMPKDNLPENGPINMPEFKYMYKMFDWGPLDIEDNETADFQSVSFILKELEKEHQQPFFLACGIYRPHVPWYVPQKYFDMFPLDSVQLPATMTNDLEDIGDFAKSELIQRGGNYHQHVIEADQWKKAVQGYLASLAYADAMFGELISALEKSNYAENTIVVVWSDHGWQLGEKEHWRKFALWENVIRSVLMVQTPDMKNKSEIRPVNYPVSLIDIYPTLVDLCGLPRPNHLDGQSLFLDKNAMIPSPPRPALTTYDFGSYSVRFEDWHYIQYLDGSNELYNLERDPEEYNNISDLEEFQNKIKELAGYIPHDPVPLPENSLIELMEHHIAPIKSMEYYLSEERKVWMERFKE